MNFEEQIKKIDELVKKGNKASYKLALDKIINLQKKIKPNSFVQNFTGLIIQRSGRMMDAIKYYERAHSLDPKNISPLNNLAYIYEKLKNWELSKYYFDKAKEIDPNNLIYLINISNYYLALNQHENSTNSLLKALKIDPENRNVLYNLARNYANDGKFAESIELIEKVIKNYKNFFPAHIQYVNLNKNIGKEYLNSLLDIAHNNTSDETQKADLYLAIANVYEKIKDYENFFKFLKKANLLYRDKNRFNKEKKLKLISSIISYFKEFDFTKKFQNYKGDKKIIFVCGLPRSGTTLIEQILSSHSKVSGQGELEYLSWGFTELYLKDGKFDRNKFDLNLSKNQNLLADIYFKKLKFHEISENIIADKMPLNFIHIGFIHVCFPNAKIILTNRNPKDVCFSIYRTSFTSDDMNWSFSEEDILDYREIYNKITDFWKTKLKDKIYEIKYEDLISNNENEVRKMLDFCELEFEKECLDHSKNSKSKIDTASLHQARQPIYKTSIDNSKKYEKYLHKFFSKLN